jgi:hypothetical protein
MESEAIVVGHVKVYDVIVVAPVLFLIDEDSVGPRSFLGVSLVFACCMSMLLFIFVPLMMRVQRHEREPSLRGFSNLQMPSARLFASARLSTRFRFSKRHLSAPPDALRTDNFISATDEDPEHRRAASMMTTVPLSERSEGPSKGKSAKGTDVSKGVAQELDSSSADADSSPIQESAHALSSSTDSSPIQESAHSLSSTEQSEQVPKQVDCEGGSNGKPASPR